MNPYRILILFLAVALAAPVVQAQAYNPPTPSQRASQWVEQFARLDNGKRIRMVIAYGEDTIRLERITSLKADRGFLVATYQSPARNIHQAIVPAENVLILMEF